VLEPAGDGRLREDEPLTDPEVRDLLDAVADKPFGHAELGGELRSGPGEGGYALSVRRDVITDVTGKVTGRSAGPKFLGRDSGDVTAESPETSPGLVDTAAAGSGVSGARRAS